MRTILAVIFPVAIFALGSAIQVYGTGTSNILLSDIGYAVMGGPLILCGVAIVLYSSTQKWRGDYTFIHVWHIAILVTLLAPIVIVVANPATPMSEHIYPTLTFMVSVWLVYWVCRFLVEGTLIRRKDEPDEHESSYRDRIA